MEEFVYMVVERTSHMNKISYDTIGIFSTKEKAYQCIDKLPDKDAVISLHDFTVKKYDVERWKLDGEGIL